METSQPSNGSDGSCVRCLDWLTLKLELIKEGSTPPKWKYILLIFSCLFVSSCSLTYLFSFLPEMILHLGYREDEKGLYVGLVASSVFAGRIFGSVFWGWMADRKGRKCVLLITVVLTGISAIVFGFSVNIQMAMLLRFLCGLFNGVEVTAKAALYDVSDNSNQAVGMTIVSFAWGAGLMSGPLVAGFLVAPCTKWPNVFEQGGLFGQFPFLLSCIFPFIFSVFVFFIILFKFDETYVTSCSRKPDELQIDCDEEEDCMERSPLPLDNEVTKPNYDRDRLHVHPTQNDSDDNSHKLMSILSHSLTSLNPEAQMSICLGEEVLIRQRSSLSTQENYCPRRKSTSQPELTLGFNQRLQNDGHDHSNMSIPGESSSSTQIMYRPQLLSSPIHENGYLKMMDKDSIYKPNTKKKVYDMENRKTNSVNSSLPVELEQCGFKTDEESSHNMKHCVSKLFNQLEEGDEVCGCCDQCCYLRCCRIFTNSSLHKLLRLRDVWTTTMLFSLLSVITIVIDELFPVFASTRTDYGGLGFSSKEIGMAIGVLTIPLVTFQVKLFPFLVNKLGIRKTYIAMAFVCLISSQCIPVLRVLNDSPVWLWICLALVKVPFKTAVNCCFASSSLLLNNSVTQDLAGQVNGLSMMTTAIGRTVIPVLAGSLYSWTVSHGQFIGAPFDTGLTFFVFGIFYGVSIIECLFIRSRLDKQKK